MANDVKAASAEIVFSPKSHVSSDHSIIFVDQMPAEKYPQRILDEGMSRLVIGSPLSDAVMCVLSFFSRIEESTIMLVHGWQLVWKKIPASIELNIRTPHNYTPPRFSNVHERIGDNYRMVDLIIPTESVPQDDPRTMGREKFFPGKLNTFLGSVSGLSGYSQRCLRVQGLLSSGILGVFGQTFSGTPKTSRIDYQSARGQYESPGYIDEPPFCRRIIAAMFSSFGGTWLHGQGWYNFYKQRRAFGTALI